MKLFWSVFHRRQRQRGDRKVRVGRFVVMAETAEAAVALVRDTENWGRLGGTFSATEIPGVPVFDMGCHVDDVREGE